MKSTVHMLFLDHPASVGESYAGHMAQAAGFAGMMALGAIACFVHALIPGLCRDTGSRIIGRLNDRMIVNRRR